MTCKEKMFEPTTPPESRRPRYVPPGPGQRDPWKEAHQRKQREEALEKRRLLATRRETMSLAEWKQWDYAQLKHAKALVEASKKKTWWKKGWNVITRPLQSFEDIMISWGKNSETGRKAIHRLTDMVGDLNHDLNDPVRNPVTAAFSAQLRGGTAGFVYGVRSTFQVTRETIRSIIKGDRERTKRYGGALLRGVVKGWLWGVVQTVAQLVWGTIKMATPIGLLETGPAWWSAISDARVGKRGGWDVTLTSLFLIANVIGMYGTVNGVRTANEFRTFQDTLSPSVQSQYISLSAAEQIKIFNVARSTGASPAAIEFYLDQIGYPSSPLVKLSLTDALRLSALVEQTGRSSFLLEYASRYGTDPAMMRVLLDMSPGEVSAIKYVYDASTGQYRDLSTGRFLSPRNLTWPSNRGFATDPVDTTLTAGTMIDRYGSLTGRYAGEPGTSVLAREMAVGSDDMPYTKLKVIKPITVLSGPAAPVPELGAVGGGMQYYFDNGIQWWIDNGYLEIIP